MSRVSLPAPGRPTSDHVVVVLNYHGRTDTEACLESLLADPEPPRVVLVDNGSDDALLAAVTTRWPQVTTLQTGDNLGFAGGMNVGLRHALAAGASTVTLLNNDTVVPSGTIGALAERALLGEAVSPVVEYADRPEPWFAGGAIHRETGIAEHVFGERLAALPSTEAVRTTEVLAGCCVCTSAETWSRVGPLDERYFLTFEDSDWSMRARALGVPLTVLLSTRIAHRVSASFVGAAGRLGPYYYTRNSLLFTREHTDARARTRLRLLRRHLLAPTTAAVRARQWRTVGQHGVLVGTALMHHARGRHGRAPAWLERRAQRWADEGTPSR